MATHHNQMPPIPGVNTPINKQQASRLQNYAHPRPEAVQAARAKFGDLTGSPDGGPPIRGARVYTIQGNAIKVGDKSYYFRRLGIRDANKVYGIVEQAISWGVHDAVAKLGPFVRALSEANRVDGGDHGEAWLLAIISPFLGIRIIENDLIALVESVMIDSKGNPIEAESLSDPELFPLDAFPRIVAALCEHPDILSFFGSCGEVATHPLVLTAMSQIEGKVKNLISAPSQDSTVGNE